jgi:hypothetical protein
MFPARLKEGKQIGDIRPKTQLWGERLDLLKPPDAGNTTILDAAYPGRQT